MQNYRELLLVVALSGMLLLLLGAAAAGQGSPRWQSQICRSNLKNIHQAAMAYAADHAGAVQPLIVQKRPTWGWWYQFLMPYVKNPRIFACPAHPRNAAHQEQFSEEDDLLPATYDINSHSYGMNYALGPTINPQRPAPVTAPYNYNAVVNPAHVVCFGDAKMPSATLRGTKWCWKDDYAPIHQGRQLMVFVDGHVEDMGPDNLGLMDATDGWKKDAARWVNWKK